MIQLSSLEVQVCLQLADPSSCLGNSGTQELAAGPSSNVVSLVPVSHEGAYTEAVGYQAGVPLASKVEKLDAVSVDSTSRLLPSSCTVAMYMYL